MHWFKHYSNCQDSDSLSKFIEKYGVAEYGRYWLLLELLAKRFDGNSDTFRIHSSIIRQTIRVRSWNDLETFLERLRNDLGMISTKIGDDYEIKTPILLELQGRDFKRARTQKTKSARKNKNKNKNKEEDKDKELIYSGDNNLNDLPKKSSSELTIAKADRAAIWQSYYFAYVKIHRTEPKRNQKTNSLVMQLQKRLGKDAADVVKFYLQHTKSIYLSSMHDLSLCVRDAEALYAQWKKGIQVHERNVKEFTSKIDSEMAFQQRIKRAKEFDRQQENSDHDDHQQFLLEKGEL